MNIIPIAYYKHEQTFVNMFVIIFLNINYYNLKYSKNKGARFHPQMKMIEDKNRFIVIQKGTESDGDSYSAFYDNYKFSKKTSLDVELKARNISDLYICGLATDVCVAATAKDSLKFFYKVNIVEDACRGVDRASIAVSKKELIRAGAKIINSKELLEPKK